MALTAGISNANSGGMSLALRIDRLGAGVSFLCAIHCAVTPFLVAILPVMGHRFLANPALENSILGSSRLLASFSVYRGLRIHRQPRILILFGAALVLIVIGRTAVHGAMETPFLAAGGFLFVCGHFVNHRLSRCCAHHREAACH